MSGGTQDENTPGGDQKGTYDEVTGQYTTGHEWDGLQELNTPMPKWWLYTFYACIAWAVVYFVVMPGWPVPTSDGWDATGGVIDYDQRRVVDEAVAANQARLAPYNQAILDKSFGEILADPDLVNVAYTAGSVAFKDNCAGCHGTGAQGFAGYPNLNDDDWIWGGTIEDIAQTITHGIRWDADYDTRFNEMPAFGRDELLTREEVKAVTEYVVSLGARAHDAGMVPLGAEVFEYNCASCHEDNAAGNKEMGAPNLTDAIWLYGGSREEIYDTIYNARNGVMPAWSERLDAATIKQLAVYVYSLGGGEETMAAAPSADTKRAGR